MNKKPFKPVFNNPLRKSAVQPEREIPSREHGDWTQVQVMGKALAPLQPKKPNIKKKATDISRKLQNNLKKKQNKEDTMSLATASLTDTQYDEIFSLAINRAMAGGIPSPVTELDAGNSDMEDEIEDRAAVPNANEALPPQEAATGPTEYSGKQFQAKEEIFSKKRTAEPHINDANCMSEITPAEDSAKAKKRNAKDIQGVAKKSKVPPLTGTSCSPSFPVHSKKQETLKLQDKKQKHGQECQKHSNTFQNFKSACKDTDSVPNMKKKREKQTSKLLDNSSSQKSALAKQNESAVKDSSQLNQSGCLVNHTGGHSKHSTQCSHHSQKSGHICNNKHSQNLSNVVQESSMHQCSVIHKSASQSQYSQAFWSQPGPELSLKERLLWLQKRRDVGLWVQCCRPTCNKWRYLHDIRDPVDVPQEWFCHMNSDKMHNSCAAPEKPPTPLEEEDLIHNIYTAGSIVWGRLDGYPWWPAIVDDDPDTEQYYWLNSFSDIPTHYNVVFFDEKDVTRAWLTPGAMVPFTGYESSKEFRTTIARGTDYAKRLQDAKLQAQKALPMGIGERLRTFGFLARYKGPIGHIKRREQHKRKTAEDEDMFSQNSDKDETVSAHRNLQRDGDKEKHKRKRAKPDGFSKRTTNKATVQAAVREKRTVMSEATGKISKINSNKVQENDTASTPKWFQFSSSLYTQELSNNETHNPNDKFVTETLSATKPEHVSAPESTQPSKTNEEQETTDGMEIPSDSDNETQFNIIATLDETIINCSQDMFSSQTTTTEQNMSEKNKADTATRISTDITLHKLSTSSGASGINVNANHENKNSEFTADSCMATVGEKSDSEQMQTADCTNRVVDMVADKNTAKHGATNGEDNHRILTEVGSTASVLQPDMHNPSTSTAPTGSHSNCSDMHNPSTSTAPTGSHSNCSDMHNPSTSTAPTGSHSNCSDMHNPSTSTAPTGSHSNCSDMHNPSTSTAPTGSHSNCSDMHNPSTSTAPTGSHSNCSDMHNPSTSTAPTGSHSNCSDSMPLVPDIQQKNFQTKANQNCDAVVPQLDDDKSDDNSPDTLDFEPEE